MEPDELVAACREWLGSTVWHVADGVEAEAQCMAAFVASRIAQARLLALRQCFELWKVTHEKFGEEIQGFIREELSQLAEHVK